MFENEFIKREKVPKLEILDMDIGESKPILDISQQPKDTLGYTRFFHDFVSEKSIKIVPSKGDKGDNQKELRCKTCDETFKCKSILINHNKTYHSNSVTFKCGTCDKTFNNAQKLTDHSNWHKYKCEKCQKYFQNKHRLELHRKTHTTAAAVWKVWLD